MPWYAQHTAGHPNHADSGSDLERVLQRLDYVEVPAPGAEAPEQTSDDEQTETGSEQTGTGDGPPTETADPRRATRRDVARGHGGPVDDELGA
ncbi:hypothetical protein VA596_49890 [Amycolatopsis sp., V23-08]|uniref:Uncharacterized protein n=1 Tax=Amycolatopsis heterodermiae TaxID=3110235 RepID=A0ABU5RN30_9PSEU|nr:hypothetical protein [Amycolatopsis sp., V23-08]MEA5367723.1 hypothetical protein [Amycolatopsis sp., V23-08]